jgi:hypothetical protein
MKESLPATLNLNRLRPVGNFQFHFIKKDHTKKNGTRCLYIGGVTVTHLPFSLSDNSMKELYALMKANKTDVFYDGMHCYSTGINCLVIVEHSELTEWIKNIYIP